MQAVLTQKGDKEYTKIPTGKYLLWFAIVSIIMFFAAFTSAYMVRQADGNWVLFKLPKTFTLSTIFILLSSVSMQMSFRAVKRNQQKNLKVALLITLGLGLAFVFCQLVGWNQLVKNGIYFVGNPSGSFLYVLSGMHLLHLVAGILALVIVNTKAPLEKYNSGNFLGVELCTIYWHFLDLLWIYLFVFLNLSN